MENITTLREDSTPMIISGIVTNGARMEMYSIGIPKEKNDTAKKNIIIIISGRGDELLKGDKIKDREYVTYMSSKTPIMKAMDHVSPHTRKRPEKSIKISESTIIISKTYVP